MNIAKRHEVVAEHLLDLIEKETEDMSNDECIAVHDALLKTLRRWRRVAKECSLATKMTAQRKTGK